MLLTFFMYLSFTAFVGFSLYKGWLYAHNPLHSRWELYPVPKEPGERGRYGGSYYEEAEWWTGPRQVSRAGEYKEMLKEMLFMKTLFINRRKHWLLSYAMHLGIYLLGLFTVLLLAGAVTKLSGLQPATFDGVNSHPWAMLLYYLTLVTGLSGALLAAFGSAALILRRVLNGTLRKYTSGGEYFNLLFILIAAVSGLVVWSTDSGFDCSRDVMMAMLTFAPVKAGAALTVHILLFGALLIYIPQTKMSHYVGKFFTYRKIAWDNEPNLRGSEMEKRVKKALDYKPKDSWSAPHVNSVASGRDNP